MRLWNTSVWKRWFPDLFIFWHVFHRLSCVPPASAVSHVSIVNLPTAKTPSDLWFDCDDVGGVFAAFTSHGWNNIYSDKFQVTVELRQFLHNESCTALHLRRDSGRSIVSRGLLSYTIHFPSCPNICSIAIWLDILCDFVTLVAV